METKALKEWRAKEGFTLDQAADHLSVDRKTLWRWEKGNPFVPTHRLEEVSGKTGLTRQQLRPDLYEGMEATGT